MLSPVLELVKQLRLRGVILMVDGPNLLASPRSALTDLDRQTIRKYKSELIAWLTAPVEKAPDPPEWAPSQPHPATSALRGVRDIASDDDWIEFVTTHLANATGQTWQATTPWALQDNGDYIR